MSWNPITLYSQIDQVRRSWIDESISQGRIDEGTADKHKTCYRLQVNP